MKAIVLALCAALAACSDTGITVRSGPPGSDDLNGNWSISEPSQPPGNAFRWTLAVNGDTVSGSGVFAGEAGPFGTMTVHGTGRGDSLHVDVEFVYDHIFSLAPYTARFEGALVSRTAIDGLLVRPGGVTQTLHLMKAP